MNGVLRERIAGLTGHKKEHITLGAGSSELLGLACLWATRGKGVSTPYSLNNSR